MARLARIVSVVLLALWLPATLHCALEASGILGVACADEGCSSSDSACVSDGCVALESAQYHAADSARVSAPLAHACVAAVCAALAVPIVPAPTDGVTPVPATSPTWVPTWHFARRAAPPSRAPASLLA